MTFKSNRRRWLGVAAALTLGVSALGWAPVTQAADDWPERAVNLVVPFPAGGPVDTAARFVAKPLAEKWGEPAVIDNRAGAGGIVAARYVVNEKPDGYTFLLPAIDRKSTRLNSSHVAISYAVFCLKKKSAVYMI